MFPVQITEAGAPRMSPATKRSFYQTLGQHAGKKGWLEFHLQRKTRSTPQNAYLWGVVYRTISEDTGQDLDDIHEFYKWKLLPPRRIVIGGEAVQAPPSTRYLTKVEFGEYVEQVRAHAATELGIEIASPPQDGEKDEAGRLKLGR